MAAENSQGVPIWAVILAFIGIAQFGLGAAFTWLWNRSTTLEGRIDGNAKEARDMLDKRGAELWDGVHAATKKADDTRAEMLTALREVPTKHDLAAMEARLSSAIRGSGKSQEGR